MKRFYSIACRRRDDGDARRFDFTIIRGFLCLLVALALSGCGSIFDPAPYSPLDAGYIKDSNGASYHVPDVVVFSDLDVASENMLTMAYGYARKRNELMGQQLIFDVPAIGLGVASVASVAFHGAATVSTGLALGAATVYGSKTYFQPGTRIAAYNSAAQSMLCGASAAATLSMAQNSYQPKALSTQEKLTIDIQEAGDYLSNLSIDGSVATLTSDERTAMLTARDSAQKALADLTAALQVLDFAPVKMQSFALATIGKATSTIVSGEPDPATILKTIQAGVMPGIASPAAQTSANGNVMHVAALTVESGTVRQADPVTDLINRLNSESTDGESYATGINTAWSSFTSCTTGG